MKKFGKFRPKFLIAIKKLQKNDFTDQNISGLVSVIDFSPELDIVKTNLPVKFKPNRTNGCPVFNYSG